MASWYRPASRAFHCSPARKAITRLEMPAMSPTMTEGGIASWKKKAGDAFVAGDVLLEIETDKATIDVEAQDDGVMGLTIVPAGSKNVVVGQVIALLAESGDDISNLQPPTEDSSVKPKQQSPPNSESPVPRLHPSSTGNHSQPLFPSVHRLLVEYNISKPSEITGTGVRGMLTKGDVLAFLGKASGPLGTWKKSASPPPPFVKPQPQSLDGPALRRLIVSGMLQNSLRMSNVKPAPPPLADFDWILSDYTVHTQPPAPKIVSQSTQNASWLNGLI